MKKILLVFTITLFSLAGAFAQSANEIIDNYFENTGGKDAWGALKGIKMRAKVSQGGMEIPIEIVQLKDGRQYTMISFQGMKIMQNVFDGNILWSTNFQTQKPEKADDEMTAMMKNQANDFPDTFWNYKDKGYSVELLGKEEVEGAETFKLKVITEPTVVDGDEKETAIFFYFDSEDFVPIKVEREVLAGPQKGAVGVSMMSDYQEVDGIYFPFSLTQGVKGGPSQPLIIEEIIINPEVDESIFVMPAGN